MEQVKQLDNGWQSGKAKYLTFIVTKDCQLICKYCYLVGKNSTERMSISTAKKAVDLFLSGGDFFREESVVFDFIGGEPFLEIDLIDQICDYIKEQLYMKSHKWFDSYRFSFSTNGLNYHSEKVQNYIRKNIKHLSVGITIDGTKQKHDLNRIYPTGKGSYDDVVANIPLWIKQFPDSHTKVTISSDDIPYIKESVLHLYSLGIKEVDINCVYENVWKDGDDTLFEEQLIQLADEIINKKLYREYACSFFKEYIGKPITCHSSDANWCGTGRMIAVDASGNLYPCNRFTKFALSKKCARIVGNIDDGVNENLLRPFLSLTRSVQSSRECMECDVAEGCSWCQGENYDSALTDTVFQRSTSICKMHKAQVKANNYYWNRLFVVLEAEETVKQTCSNCLVTC